MDDNKSAVKLEARAIPVPVSISAEAQAVLARLVGEDGRPLHALYEMPQPDDFSGWMKTKAAADAQYATAVKGLAGTLRTQSSLIEAGSAIIHHATPDVISDERHATIDLHGGALVFGGGEASRVSACRQAEQHGVPCYGIDYRMPPEHPCP